MEEEGSVATVSPEVGQSIERDGTITLGLSTGTIEMPSVTGQQQAAATQTLQDAGLTNVTVTEVDSDQPPGTVVATDPAAGNQVGATTPVTLQVSGGPGEIIVPNVRGQSPADADRNLRAAGFTNISTNPTENDGSVREGTVLNTNPEPGESAAPDTQIVLLIAGPEPSD